MFINLLLRPTISFGISLLLSASLFAQGNFIRGKVRDTSGRNIAQALVTLQTGTGLMINQTTTNNEGDFSFGGLSDTSYILVVSFVDYQSVSERVEFLAQPSTGSPGELRTIEITLPPKTVDRIPPPRSTFVQTVPPAAREAFDRGMKLAKDGKSLDTVEAFREALSVFPDYFDAHFALANEFIKIERLDDAISELEHARRINPKDGRVFQAFGLVMSKQKKYAIAAIAFGEAVKLSPNDAQILLLRGAALLDHIATLNPSLSQEAAAERERLLTTAEKDLLKAYQVSGQKLASVHLQLARLYEKKGDRTRAADELGLYLKAVPDAKNADAIRDAIKKLRAPNQ